MLDQWTDRVRNRAGCRHRRFDRIIAARLVECDRVEPVCHMDCGCNHGETVGVGVIGPAALQRREVTDLQVNRQRPINRGHPTLNFHKGSQFAAICLGRQDNGSLRAEVVCEAASFGEGGVQRIAAHMDLQRAGLLFMQPQ